ncbi:hypothetical protein I0Q12_03685, partial [Rhodococcus sp. CX]|uniref:hypothetical protein n=1 Tax=Rhodococcus sp. CX TaxID=2789880 RepID=UPI0018CCD644
MTGSSGFGCGVVDPASGTVVGGSGVVVTGGVEVGGVGCGGVVPDVVEPGRSSSSSGLCVVG